MNRADGWRVAGATLIVALVLVAHPIRAQDRGDLPEGHYFSDCRPHSAVHQPDSAVRAVTTLDLVSVVQIPVAAMSPDASRAAWMLVCANPLRDVYQVAIRELDLRGAAKPTTLRTYRVAPDHAFNDGHWLLSTAGDIRWIDRDRLVLAIPSAGGMQLIVWNASSKESRVLMRRRERIEIDGTASRATTISVLATDCSVPHSSIDSGPPNLALRVLDSYRFYAPLLNAKLGRACHSEHFALSFDRGITLRREGASQQAFESSTDEWLPQRIGTTHDGDDTAGESETWSYDVTTSRSGAWTATAQIRALNLSCAGCSYSAFRLIARSRDGAKRVLVPDTRPFIDLYSRILGWKTDDSVLYLYGSPERTVINRVTLDGTVSQVLNAHFLLEIPCPFPRRCQVVSVDDNYALLVRSDNVKPQELIRVDLRSGSQTVLDAPNEWFAQASVPEVRFYAVQGTGGDSWGRLYLPLHYSTASRYPLVITQYLSSPGFSASTGDEVPILSLVANGIAVFAMDSGSISQNSASGDSRMALERVRRPLAGMRWMIQKLSGEGIVDPRKLGLTGVSYGSEIALYAYWNWADLRAVSSSTGSWDPVVYIFGGVRYADFLTALGYPPPNEKGMPFWREYAAGLNASANLPPLLLQSPDEEALTTVPTWFQLRQAGAAVEWYVYPKEVHVKRSPADKWWVFQRNLDWFRFWLQGYEDRDPTKEDQYRRWEKLCDEQVANSPDRPSFCVPSRTH